MSQDTIPTEHHHLSLRLALDPATANALGFPDATNTYRCY
jgi:hypothetical protein